MPKLRVLVILIVLAVATAACGDGEDRPGQVAASTCGEHGHASGSGSGSGSASGSASGSGTGGELAFEEADADTEVHVTLQDYVFTDLPATVKGPKVFFEAEVEGSNCHELEVLDSSGKALGEIPAFASGETKRLALELPAGTYTVQCLVEEGEKTHADLGMKTQLVVT